MFYGWTRVDEFFAAWREAGFQPVGHLVFQKTYASKSRFLKYQHEQGYLLAKGRPPLPRQPLADVIDMPYSGNKLHPTQKTCSGANSLAPQLHASRRTGTRSLRRQRFHMRCSDPDRPEVYRCRARSYLSSSCHSPSCASPGENRREKFSSPRTVIRKRDHSLHHLFFVPIFINFFASCGSNRNVSLVFAAHSL